MVEFAHSAESAVNYRTDPHRVGLAGFSMGAWLAFRAAVSDTSIDCVGGLEMGDMGGHGLSMRTDPEYEAWFTEYTNSLIAPGGPLHAEESGAAFADTLLTNADRWALSAQAPAFRDRAILLVGSTENTEHADLVSTLESISATRLTSYDWVTDHSFSARRIELARTVVAWLQKACGF
ncbi:MAG: hypothetical protein ABR527_06450 [Gemmatimonadota bacterium]